MTYVLAKDKDELTLDEKLEMVNQVSSYDGRFEDLRYEENAEDFFDTFYGSRPYELARAISYGEYNFMDPYVKINDYGNIESAHEHEIEEQIDDQFDELSEAFVELLNEGNIEDYNDICAEVSALRREELTVENLNESYYEKSNDSYTLEFLVDDQTIFVSNIPGKDHTEARENEYYWSYPENVHDAVNNAEDKDITDKNGISINDEAFCRNTRSAKIDKKEQSMTSEEKRINQAFWSVVDGNFSEEDKSTLLEHKNDIYTCDLTENATNILSKGRNGFSIFADSSKSWRQESYRKGYDFTVQGTLGEILAYVAEMSDTKLPKELQHESPGRNLEFFNIRDLCGRSGDFHSEIIQDRYLYDGSAITGDDVEKYKAIGKDIKLNVLDLVNAERKTLVYNHKEMQQRLDDSLDLDKAFTVEQKSAGIRATIEANKEKAATKEPTKPSKEHAIGEDR